MRIKYQSLSIGSSRYDHGSRGIHQKDFIKLYLVRDGNLCRCPGADEKNVVQGVLAGVANLDALNDIMRERAGLGDTGETYLVGSDYLMLTKPRDPRLEELPPVNTQGARLALRGMTGSGLYENYQSPAVSVVGVYRWIP